MERALKSEEPDKKERPLAEAIIALAALLLGLPLLFFVIAFALGNHHLEHELGYRVRVQLPAGFSGCTDLRFGEPGAPPTRAEGAVYVVDLPADGRWHSSTQLKWGETLSFAFYAPAASGWQRVEPSREPEGGATRSFADGSVAPWSACFDPPSKKAQGRGPGPMP